MKKQIRLLLLFFILLFPKLAYAYEYEITDYHIDVVVNENNTFDIIESISVNFNEYKHGIYRNIPIRNEVQRLDGTVSKNRAKVTLIDVSEEYETSINLNEYQIKIGSANYTLMGPHDYVIKYNYNIGKDPLKDKDELYLNLIGTEWDTTISNITFSIKMPKDYDKSKLGFSVGSLGSTNSSDVRYNQIGNDITGYVIRALGPGEALTIRLELPEGYFVGAGIPVNPMVILMFVIPALGVLIALVSWLKYGKDDKVIDTVEFYPPEGFNSLEVGFIYKGKAEKEDVTSLLVYLANKGYLKIKEEAKKNFLTNNTFTLIKLKDYDGDNEYERKFFNGLFSFEHADVTKDETGKMVTSVTLDALEDSFYTTTYSILSDVNAKENKKQIITPAPFGKNALMFMFILASIFTAVLVPYYEYNGLANIGMVIGITLFYMPFYAVGIFVDSGFIFKIFLLGFIIFHSGAFFWSLGIIYAVLSNVMYILGVIVCLGGAIIIGIFMKYMPRRTKLGNELLGKIKGFKHFLETVEKEKLESMVQKDPTYFYDILPFTYVLGVSEKWMEKFESIHLVSPDWYDSYRSFNHTHFSSFMNSAMTSANSNLSSSPGSSSSGGGFSGGGSSGGGSGGGGGGSW
ncbi:MAG: DUF2207 domain-containing protein [Bacilli bacterium]|nr:DUF2207 domain-containing protein [Bacilli bacterium]